MALTLFYLIQIFRSTKTPVAYVVCCTIVRSTVYGYPITYVATVRLVKSLTLLQPLGRSHRDRVIIYVAIEYQLRSGTGLRLV
jgi:hypothetical protein